LDNKVFDIIDARSNHEVHGILSSRSLVAPRGRRDGRTDMRNLLVAFRDFSNEP